MRRFRKLQAPPVHESARSIPGHDSEETDSIFSLAIVEHLRIIVGLHDEQAVLDTIAGRMTETLRGGGKILLCGNGGSAADAQHLAAEMMGRFQRERSGLAAVALTTDSSVLTSIANDYGYNEVFRRQVEALARPGDLLVALSTSGESENVCAAVAAARIMDVYTVALCGEGGGRLAELADIALRVPSRVTARIQEAHIFCGHVLCASVETALLDERASHGSRATSAIAEPDRLSMRDHALAEHPHGRPLSFLTRTQTEPVAETLVDFTTPQTSAVKWQKREVPATRTDAGSRWL